MVSAGLFFGFGSVFFFWGGCCMVFMVWVLFCGFFTSESLLRLVLGETSFLEKEE